MPKIDFMFLFPGNASSGLQWINAHMAMTDLMLRGYRVGMRHARGCNIYGVRNKCLSVKGSEKGQKPLEGTEYGHLVWVDADNFITAEKVLFLASHDKDIVGAWYRQYSMGPVSDENKAACGFRRIEYFREEDKVFSVQHLKEYKVRPLRVSHFKNHKGSDLVEVDYLGLGLVVMKYGVMESIDYPWFRSWVIEWEEEDRHMAEIVTDDDALCWRLKEAGFKFYIDPLVNVEHEKPVIV